VTVFDPDDAFHFGASWTSFAAEGAPGTGSAVQAGDLNLSNESDCTQLSGYTSRNAAFIGWNNPQSGSLAPTGTSVAQLDLPWNGHVGVFGRTGGTTRSAGVVGLCGSGGCGAYGIAGCHPKPWTAGSSAAAVGARALEAANGPQGFGVVGRAMDGLGVDGLDSVLATQNPSLGLDFLNLAVSVGVAGTSSTRLGVRGLAGNLGPHTLDRDIEDARGGVFSAGSLFQASVGTVTGEWFSSDALPQMTLTPFFAPGLTIESPLERLLPHLGRLGDLYALVSGDDESGLICTLFLCIRQGDGSVAAPTCWAPLLVSSPRLPTHSVSRGSHPGDDARQQFGSTFDPDDPFRMGPTWAEVFLEGSPGFGSAQASGQDIAVGATNSASPNNGTCISGGAANNASLFVINRGSSFAEQNGTPPSKPGPEDVDGVVGVFGRGGFLSPSLSTALPGASAGLVPELTFMPPTAAGVVGQADERGVGVYGLCAGSFVDGSATLPGHFQGIGVVGRAMDGFQVEDRTVPIETIFNYSIGVLGISKGGIGVLGHGGPPAGESVPRGSLLEARGGVFSTGFTIRTGAPDTISSIHLSRNAVAQLQLVPSVAGDVPLTGHWGDLYVGAAVGSGEQVPSLGCVMFLCQTAGGDVPNFPGRPQWAPFLLGPVKSVP
jgi:hypothetical protein